MRISEFCPFSPTPLRRFESNRIQSIQSIHLHLIHGTVTFEHLLIPRCPRPVTSRKPAVSTMMSPVFKVRTRDASGPSNLLTVTVVMTRGDSGHDGHNEFARSCQGTARTSRYVHRLTGKAAELFSFRWITVQ